MNNREVYFFIIKVCFFIMFFCSTGAFAKVISTDYDRQNHHIKIRYNAQGKKDFLPYRDDIFSAIKNTVTKKNRTLSVHIKLILWDCEEKTDDEYGFWSSLFYPTSKRKYYRECQKKVERIRERARMNLNSSNESNAYLNEKKRARAKEKSNLRRHTTDITYNLNVQKNLNKLEESMEDLENNEKVIQRLITDMKNYIEKKPSTNLLSVISSFREQIEEDQRYNNPLIGNFLNKLEYLYDNIDTEKTQSLFFRLDSFLQQKQSLSQPISLVNNDVEKLKNTFNMINKFTHIFDHILFLLMQSNPPLELWLNNNIDYSIDSIPSIYGEVFNEWDRLLPGKNITIYNSLKQTTNKGYITNYSPDLAEVFFAGERSYPNKSYFKTIDNSVLQTEEIKKTISEKLSLNWTEVEQQISNERLPLYVSTYFKEQYKYNDPNSIEVFMQYEEIMSELLSFFEELLDTFSPALLSDLENFKEDLRSDSVLFGLTQDLTNQVELIIKNKEVITNNIDEAKKLFSNLNEQVSEKYKASAFYHIFEFIKLRENEIKERLVILQNRKKNSEKQISNLDSTIRVIYDDLSQSWGVPVSDIRKLDPMYVDFSFDLVGSYISKSNSGDGGSGGYSANSCYNCLLR